MSTKTHARTSPAKATSPQLTLAGSRLKKLTYIDQGGQERVWEVATRKTRGKAGVDVVAIGNIILRPSHPPSTILVLQYRPPCNAICVEWPAGLIDAEETPEEAAVRELRETGYEGKVISVSPTITAIRA